MDLRMRLLLRRCDRPATTQRSVAKANPEFTSGATGSVCDETDSGRVLAHITGGKRRRGRAAALDGRCADHMARGPTSENVNEGTESTLSRAVDDDRRGNG